VAKKKMEKTRTIKGGQAQLSDEHAAILGLIIELKAALERLQAIKPVHGLRAAPMPGLKDEADTVVLSEKILLVESWMRILGEEVMDDLEVRISKLEKIAKKRERRAASAKQE